MRDRAAADAHAGQTCDARADADSDAHTGADTHASSRSAEGRHLAGGVRPGDTDPNADANSDSHPGYATHVCSGVASCNANACADCIGHAVC